MVIAPGVPLLQLEPVSDQFACAVSLIVYVPAARDFVWLPVPAMVVIGVIPAVPVNEKVPLPPVVIFVIASIPVPGSGVVIVRVCGFEVPPPGVGFVIVIVLVPATLMSLWGIVIVIRVGVIVSINDRVTPFSCTVEVAMKFEPLMAMVNVPLSATTVFGEILVICGTGFWPAVTVNIFMFEGLAEFSAFTTVMG